VSSISIELLHDKDKENVLESVNQFLGIGEIDTLLESKWLDFYSFSRKDVLWIYFWFLAGLKVFI
jgi:hypothetical protein